MTSTSHNPDGRDLLEFADAVAAGKNSQPLNDLERTYLHVHTTMQGESAAIPVSQKQSTWEDVMSTLALAPERPVSNRTKRQRGMPTPGFTPKRLRWTPLASIAAVALIVLASMGIWKMNTMPHDSPPPLAPQAAGITSGDDLSMQVVTPEATAVEDSGGSLSIPILEHVDEQPMDGPVIWLTNAGEVMYDDGTGEVKTIATGVTNVQPSMPNVIQLSSEGEEVIGKDGALVGSPGLSYYNLLSGKTLVDDGTFSSYLGGPNQYGPLTVRTIADAPNEWSIVNFETMESESISGLTGGQFRSSDSITVAVSDDHSAIAIGTSTYESEGSALLNIQSGMPGEIAVIPADLSSATWVSVPDGMPAVGNISLSSDGNRIAFFSADNFRGGSNTTVAVVDVATGEQLVRTQRVESTTFSHFQWVDDGTAFVIVADRTVQKYALDGAEPTVIFETDGTINQMPQFGESNLLHLQVSRVDLSMTTPTPETSQFVILNTATGETVSVNGKPWYMGESRPVQFTTTLAPVPVSQDNKTAILVHPITGEVYPDLIADVYDPLFDPAFDPETVESIPFVQPIINAAEANVSVVTLADGTLAVFDTTQSSMEARIVQLPEGSSDLQLQLSPDGDYLTAGASWQMQTEDSTFLVLNLTDESAEWVQGQPGQMITVVEIRDNQP